MVAEIRALADEPAGDPKKVEAEAAFEFAEDYLWKHGVDRLPIYASGKFISPPPLPPRIDAALRRIGGLGGLNQITDETRAFKRRDFVAAYLKKRRWLSRCHFVKHSCRFNRKDWFCG